MRSPIWPFRPITVLLITALALIAAAPVSAQVLRQSFVPETGFYWNPEQPGRGYAIEIQDRQVFLTIYTYTEEANPAQREPLWFSAIGTLVESANGPVTYQFTDELIFSEDGQCLGCAFREPDSTFTGRPITLRFDTAVVGELTIDGEIIPIRRFWYSPSIDDEFLVMRGQWMITTDCTAPVANDCFPSDVNVQPFEADLLDMDFDGGTNADPSTEGFRAGTNIAVAGDYDRVNNIFVIVVAEQDSQYLAYVIFGEDFGTNFFYGEAERYFPGDNLTGDGFPMFAQRISDLTFTATGSPGSKSGVPVSRTRTGSRVAVKMDVPAGLSRAERLTRAAPLVRRLEASLIDNVANLPKRAAK
ncbi:MAG: hypothetical protein AAGA23_14090 [Pseudomonadota bacterium]